MIRLVRDKYPDTSKTWRYKHSALVTPERFLGFSASGTVEKIQAHADVTWRPDIGLFSAQYILGRTVEGIAIEKDRIPTAPFDVFEVETWLQGNRISSKNITLGKLVQYGAGMEIISIPLPYDNQVVDHIVGHADTFIHEKVARIENADRIAELRLIG